TCTQTTFGATVESIAAEDGLLFYEFLVPAQKRSDRLYGAQWLAVLAPDHVYLSNPMVPRHRQYEPGVRLVSYQVLAADRRVIKQVFDAVKAAMARRHAVHFQAEALPPTWVRDATIERNCLTAYIRHRGLPTDVKIEVRAWPRTYAVAGEARRDYRVP